MKSIKHIMIAGGSGFVGTGLQKQCEEAGIAVTLVTRNAAKTKTQFPEANCIAWDELAGESFNGVDAVVNLAGAGIVDKRWNDARLEVLKSSRVDTTKKLVAAINAAEQKPDVLVQGSAVGYYGSNAASVNEDSGLGSGVLPEICDEWERASEGCTIRKVILRIGVVLGRKGGPLEVMAKPFKFFVGAPLGSGKQHLPWIHLYDLIGLIMHAINHEETPDVINGVAPEGATNRVFSKKLAKALRRPCLPIGVPGFMLRIIVGKAAQEVLLGNQHVASTFEGYAFKFPGLDAALKDLVA